MNITLIAIIKYRLINGDQSSLLKFIGDKYILFNDDNLIGLGELINRQSELIFFESRPPLLPWIFLFYELIQISFSMNDHQPPSRVSGVSIA